MCGYDIESQSLVNYNIYNSPYKPWILTLVTLIALIALVALVTLIALTALVAPVRAPIRMAKALIEGSHSFASLSLPAYS